MKRKFFFAIGLTILLMLAACGGESSSTENGSDYDDVDVEILSFNWEFDEEVYTVSAGEVLIGHSNEEGHHGIQIEGTDVNIEGDGTQTVKLDAGEYTIICNIPCGQGHSEMVATLIVE